MLHWKGGTMKEVFYLINSPLFLDKTIDEDSLPPLGQGYIATSLKTIGIDVSLIDCVKEKITAIEIINKINSDHPKYVGINIFTQNYEIVKSIIESITVKCVLFIGGQATKFLYPDIANWRIDNACFVIIGEGEYIIPSICTETCQQRPILCQNNIEVYMIDKESVYYPKDISAIKFDRTFFKNELMENHYGQQEVSIITSRGCVFNCAFCGGARSLNAEIEPRTRGQQSIETEISYLLALYPKLQSVRVLDDLFLRSKSSIQIAIDVFSKYPTITWRGMAHVLSIKNAVEFLNDLKKSGCRELFIGIESGSPKVRNKINKQGSCEDVLFVAEKILEAGIDLKGYFILGFPGEDENDFRCTLDLALSIKDLADKSNATFRTSVFQFRPYHGTKLYNELIENGVEVNECKPNDDITSMIGRGSFNFSSGNYSLEIDEVLNRYIDATQRLKKI